MPNNQKGNQNQGTPGNKSQNPRMEDDNMKRGKSSGSGNTTTGNTSNRTNSGNSGNNSGGRSGNSGNDMNR